VPLWPTIFRIRTYRAHHHKCGPSRNAGGYWVVFLFERRITVYRLMRAEQVEPSPYNHHLQGFLTCLRH
jgi:hypothetical protein